MSFEKEFKETLKEMIPKTHDDYKEIQYSDEIYVQVWSHDNGEGSFELYAIIPHDQVDSTLVGRETSQLSPEIPNVDQFYSDIEEYTQDVVGELSNEIVFHLMEVVDDGVWERDASVYSTHELTV